MRWLSSALMLVLLSAAFAFSIDSYFTHATVQTDGSLRVYESINFTLEKEYNEGYRSIRSEDFGSLDNLDVQSVKVNGQSVEFTKDLNGDNAEIVWKKTFIGANDVELSYTLKDRVRMYDDFAKVCFEHYGGEWPVDATRFRSEMTLPESSRGKDMHFEVYSEKEGAAHIDDLTVVIEMDDVPAGNYIGGCYLFDTGSVSTNSTVNGSALQLLKDERKAYGSKTILEEETPFSYELVCIPVALICALATIVVIFKRMTKPKLPESILPPSDEEPVVVEVIVRNRMDKSDTLTATIIDLINRGNIDIVELEKKGEQSAEIIRERTILMLRNKDGLKPHEQFVVDMIFAKGAEVDLDKMADDYDRISNQSEAEKHPVKIGMDGFEKEINAILDSKKLSEAADAGTIRSGWAVGLGFVSLFFLCFAGTFLMDTLMYYLDHGMTLQLMGIIIPMGIGLVSFIVIGYAWIEPKAPKGYEDAYMRWDAFRRAVGSSRLKEYPPGSAVIWGEILVYASALGMATKVKRHLSEVDKLVASKIEKMQAVGASTTRFYASALALSNLGTYGSRSGPSSGGFSSSSSGGWSSSGGGGFSSGSSGGGGFR